MAAFSDTSFSTSAFSTSAFSFDAGAPVVVAATTARSAAKRRRRVYIFEDEPEKVVEPLAAKPLTVAVQKIYVDATTEVAHPKMADVDALIARMSEFKPAILPNTKKKKKDYEDDEDDEWLLMH